MKNSFKKIILSIVISLALFTLAFFSGLLWKENKVFECLGIISLVLFLLIIIINIVLLACNRKKIYEFDIEKQYEETTNYQKEAKDFNKVYQNVKRILRNAYIYLFVILGLILIIIAYIASLPKWLFVALSALLIIFLFLLIDIISAIIGRKEEIINNKKNTNAEYPCIDAIINKCKNSLGLKEDITLVLDFDDVISVARVNSKIILYIGLERLNLSSEEELENVLYHEMAHVYNKDIDVSYSVSKKSAIFEALNKTSLSIGLTVLLFKPISLKIIKETELF